MTWSAPSDSTKPTFGVLHTPVTSAPSALAICTAKDPTPPDAPTTSTRLPASTPALRTAWSAVEPEIGTAAACTEVRFQGLRVSLAAGTAAYSANVPVALP